MKGKNIALFFSLVLGTTILTTSPAVAMRDVFFAKKTTDQLTIGTTMSSYDKNKVYVELISEGTPRLGITGCSDGAHDHKNHFFVSGDEQSYFGGYIYNADDNRYYLVGDEGLDPTNLITVDKGFYIVEDHAELVARVNNGTLNDVKCTTFEEQVISTVKVVTIDQEYTSSAQDLIYLEDGNDIGSINLKYINDTAGSEYLNDFEYAVSTDGGVNYSAWSTTTPKGTNPGEYKIKIRKSNLGKVEILNIGEFVVTSTIRPMKLYNPSESIFFYSNYDFLVDYSEYYAGQATVTLEKDGVPVTEMKESGDYYATWSINNPALYTWESGDVVDKTVKVTVEKITGHVWYSLEDEFIYEPGILNGYLCSNTHPMDVDFDYSPHVYIYSYNSKRKSFDAMTLFPDPEWMEMYRDEIPASFVRNATEIINNNWFNQWLYCSGMDNYGRATFKPDDGLYRASVAQLLMPTPIEDLIYNGEPQVLIEPAQVLEGMTAQYSFDGITWSSEIPTATAAGNYKIYFKALGDGKNIADGQYDEWNYVEVNIESTAVAKPVDITFEHASPSKELNNLVKDHHYNVYYDGELVTSASAIASLEPGLHELVVELKNKEGTHWAGTEYDTEDLLVIVQIEKLNTYLWGDEVGIIEEPYCPNDSTNRHLKYVGKDGITYKFVDADGNEEEHVEISITDPIVLEHAGVGEWFEVTSHGEGLISLHHCAVGHTAAGSLMAPAAKYLTYIGLEQTLADGGSVLEGMTMEYSLDGVNWSTEVPKAKSAGNYKVYYRVRGNNLYSDIDYDAQRYITVTILEFRIDDFDELNELIDYSIPENNVYSGNAYSTIADVKEGITVFTSDEYSIVYVKDGEVTPVSNPVDAGTYHVYISFNAEFYVYDNMIELGQLVISPKEVTVTIDNKNKVVCQANPSFTYVVSGLVDGETLNNIAVTSVGSNTVGSFDIVGEETVEGSNANYSINFQKGVFTIADHTYDNGVVTTNPTCTVDGVKTFTCTIDGCGEFYTEDVESIGHSYDNGTVTTKPTCTVKGVKTFACTHEGCTHTYTEDIDSIGHSYDNGVITTNPTCTVDGVKTFTCTHEGCTANYTEKVQSIGHSFDDGEITTKPTCTKDGVLTHHCTHEGCEETYTEAVHGSTFDIFAIVLLVLFVIFEVVWFFVFKYRALDLINIIVTSVFAAVSIILCVLGIVQGGCPTCIAFLIANVVVAILAIAFYIFIGNAPFRKSKTMSLKESLALASTVSTAGVATKKSINEYLESTHKDDVEVQHRPNYTSNGKLLLANTYFVYTNVRGKMKKVCFGYVYENNEGRVMALVKVPASYAKSLIKNHENVTLSSFPKSYDSVKWYAVPLDDSWTADDFNKMLSEVASINENKDEKTK